MSPSYISLPEFIRKLGIGRVGQTLTHRQQIFTVPSERLRIGALAELSVTVERINGLPKVMRIFFHLVQGRSPVVQHRVSTDVIQSKRSERVILAIGIASIRPAFTLLSKGVRWTDAVERGLMVHTIVVLDRWTVFRVVHVDRTFEHR